MRAPTRIPRLLLLTLALVSGLAWAAEPAAQHAKHYVCPPCKHPCDDKVHDTPGTCPDCGMKLVERPDAAEQTPAPARKKVAILLFDGVEIIDSMGPYEVFGGADYDVYTVAETRAPLTTAMGQTLVPRYAFAEAPQADVVVVPGGGVTEAQHRAPILAWVKQQSTRVQQLMSVCNGAFILANAGLLDGLSATTTAGNLKRLQALFPEVKVVDDQRVVDNGRIVTTAGLSAGIDGALHVVEKLSGRGLAQQVALNGEYDWRPRTPFVRAALADRLIPPVDVSALGDWSVASTEGDTGRWELVLEGRSALGAPQLMAKLGEALQSAGTWTRAEGSAASASRSEWRFRGRKGEPWSGVLTLKPGAAGQYTVTLAIARAGQGA
ncbi:DJ-1/PfpI family protein [Aggregicoccus sp. 17bor-14]|uniref:DJ-1/PfpI family protein n=1 Tax=Myxococcaceae TaxID=31 RepID=UPI00129D1F1D|nr:MULTISPECIES: DJ-1/PfpI family protein [Myxococcaceae]MBF5045148.1 DJ-1/PfpI family protein [Simulacricoccus sp. 17bor-14]MRI90890.1 DJ-1/PfpI family protein [Aggregicoccus sp. 17bor-14]